MINRAFRGLVLSKTAITDSIGNRFYDNRIPQGLSITNGNPAAYFRPIPSGRTRSFDGILNLQDTTTDVFVYAKTPTELEALLLTFETQLDNQSGTYNGVNIYDTATMSGDGQSWSEDHEAHVGRIEIKITIRR